MLNRSASIIVGTISGILLGGGLASKAQTLLGPTPYLCFEDSPFSGLSLGYFYLETFEDHLFNVPGVTANQGGVTSVVFGPSIHDSVDCDDGNIDGSGLLGDSFFGAADMRFTFDAAVLGSLPTHAGIVWTDGGGGATIIFEAFDASGNSLGTVTGHHADNGNNGETDEDRFYGIINLAGISAINISHNSGGLEVDHLQYGGAASGCRADLNHDGQVDDSDFVIFIFAYNILDCADPAMPAGCASDLNGDGIVEDSDFVTFVAAYNALLCPE